MVRIAICGRLRRPNIGWLSQESFILFFKSKIKPSNGEPRMFHSLSTLFDLFKN